MSDEQPKNPLHGITLKAIVTDLVERRGFANLAVHIDIRCFSTDPSIASSLKFLRKTDWARAKVEALYLRDHREVARKRERNKERAARRAFAAGQEGAAAEEDTSDGGAPDAAAPGSDQQDAAAPDADKLGSDAPDAGEDLPPASVEPRR